MHVLPISIKSARPQDQPAVSIANPPQSPRPPIKFILLFKVLGLYSRLIERGDKLCRRGLAFRIEQNSNGLLGRIYDDFDYAGDFHQSSFGGFGGLLILDPPL